MRWVVASAAGLLAVLAAMAALGAAGIRPATAQSESRSFTLYVRDGWLSMPDGAQIYVYGFTDDPSGPPKVPGPPIVVNEGDTVEVVLVNDRDPTASDLQPSGEGHTIHLHGLDPPMEHDGVPETYPPGLARQGESYTYRFVATHAGTYFYHCHQNAVEHQQMGMYGPLVVRSARGARTAYTNGPAFDREHTLVLAELGADGHEGARRAVQEGGDPYNWLRYAPDYFLVNDRAYADRASVSTSLIANPGERVLVRVINSGYVAHAVHAHGQPFAVVATDGRPWPDGPTTEVIWLGPGEKYDLLLTAGGTGALELHDHVDQPYVGGMVGAPPAAPPATASRSGEVRSFKLYVRDGWKTMPDGARIYVYGFSDDPIGPASVPAPPIVVAEGDTVEITLVNDADPTGTGHTLRLHGLDSALEGPDLVGPGESGIYRFVANRAGSYFYANASPVHKDMGMYGALVVQPGGAKTLYPGGPPLDQEYTMVLSEMDSAQHEWAQRALKEGDSPLERTAYAPNYFLINGLAYPDTADDPATMIHAAPGDRILIRAINAGGVAHSMHLHGYHFDVAATGGRPWPTGPKKDTVLIAPGETYDLVFVANQAGAFPFHDHFETAVTNNGLWLGGMHTMVSTGAEHHAPAAASLSPPRADGPTVFIRDNYFVPNYLTVSAGTTIRWEHQGKIEHSVSSLLGLFDSGPLVGGDVFTYTFGAPGRYDYFCRFHITNRGSVIAE